MSSKTASGAGEPVIHLITRFGSSSIFLVGRTPPRPTAVEEVEVPVFPDLPGGQGVEAAPDAQPESDAYSAYKPPPFRMETLRTVMDCLGEAHQQRLKTSEHLRDSSMSRCGQSL